MSGSLAITHILRLVLVPQRDLLFCLQYQSLQCTVSPCTYHKPSVWYSVSVRCCFCRRFSVAVANSEKSKLQFSPSIPSVERLYLRLFIPKRSTSAWVVRYILPPTPGMAMRERLDCSVKSLYPTIVRAPMGWYSHAPRCTQTCTSCFVCTAHTVACAPRMPW